MRNLTETDEALLLRKSIYDNIEQPKDKETNVKLRDPRSHRHKNRKRVAGGTDFNICETEMETTFTKDPNDKTEKSKRPKVLPTVDQDPKSDVYYEMSSEQPSTSGATDSKAYRVMCPLTISLDNEPSIRESGDWCYEGDVVGHICVHTNEGQIEVDVISVSGLFWSCQDILVDGLYRSCLD